MQNLVSWKTAEIIMGKNLIKLDEVLNVFPGRKDILAGYETIPFSDRLLYHCSEPNNEHVLVPGIMTVGNKQNPLTIVEMKNRFLLKYPNLFTHSEELENPVFSFTNTYTCLPKWYLLSKKVLDIETVKGFMEPERWDIERAVVYIYAWILFWILRREEIFSDSLLECADLYSRLHRTKPCLAFIDQRITIAQHPSSKMVGWVPSLKNSK